MPLYTLPDTLTAADLIEQLADELTTIYTTAENSILAEMARRARRALDELPDLTARLEAVRLLREHAERVLASIDPELAIEVVRIATEAGTAAAVAQLGITTRLPVGTPFTTTSGYALAQLAFDLQSTFDAMHLRILRWEQDEYQRLIAGQVPNVLLGVNGKLEAQKNAIAEWLAAGVEGFIDKAGRPWRVGSYVEMATRTAVARAFNDAAVYRMQLSGIHLVTITVGASACAKCAPWIGKVLSTDGITGPRTMLHAVEDREVVVDVVGTLDQAREAGWGHPNCRCQVAAYLPGLDNPPSATTYDPVKEAARDRQRALEREIRQLKRELALTDDEAEQARIKREIRATQAEVREHIEQHDLPRKRNREQVRFADGITA